MKKLLSALLAFLLLCCPCPPAFAADAALPPFELDYDDTLLDEDGEIVYTVDVVEEVSGGVVKINAPLAPSTGKQMKALSRAADLIILCQVDYAPHTANPKGVDEYTFGVSALYKGNIEGSEFWVDIDKAAFGEDAPFLFQVGDYVLLLLQTTEERKVFTPLCMLLQETGVKMPAALTGFEQMQAYAAKRYSKKPFFHIDLGMVYLAERNQPNAPFVFSGAPPVRRTMCFLNRSGTERVLLYQFETRADYQTCLHMINTGGLSYRNAHVAAQKSWVWYTNEQNNTLALSIGNSRRVDPEDPMNDFHALYGFTPYTKTQM
ncbi:hypothetical protein LJC07_00165 [Christensenellaceae bacterium OttesenSCG-928-L17]|nr:hypothetical protein [Christensenellaceae bacterium OttesenSCG-928-L17]